MNDINELDAISSKNANLVVSVLSDGVGSKMVLKKDWKRDFC